MSSFYHLSQKEILTINATILAGVFVLIGVTSMNQPSILQLDSDLHEAQSQFDIQKPQLSLDANQNETMAKQIYSDIDTVTICPHYIGAVMSNEEIKNMINCDKAKILHEKAIQNNATLNGLQQHIDDLKQQLQERTSYNNPHNLILYSGGMFSLSSILVIMSFILTRFKTMGKFLWSSSFLIMSAGFFILSWFIIKSINP